VKYQSNEQVSCLVVWRFAFRASVINIMFKINIRTKLLLNYPALTGVSGSVVCIATQRHQVSPRTSIWGRESTPEKLIPLLSQCSNLWSGRMSDS